MCRHSVHRQEVSSVFYLYFLEFRVSKKVFLSFSAHMYILSHIHTNAHVVIIDAQRDQQAARAQSRPPTQDDARGVAREEHNKISSPLRDRRGVAAILSLSHTRTHMTQCTCRLPTAWIRPLALRCTFSRSGTTWCRAAQRTRVFPLTSMQSDRDMRSRHKPLFLLYISVLSFRQVFSR